MARRLTESLIKQQSGEFDLESVQHLRLDGLGLQRIENMGVLTNLVELNISSNALQNLSGLEKCTALQKLDASFNQIASLDHIGGLSELQSLVLTGNNIERVGVLSPLRALHQLRSLELQRPAQASSNGVCTSPTYFFDVCAALPGLSSLDGENVRLKRQMSDAMQHSEDAAKASRSAAVSSVPVSRPWCEGFDWGKEEVAAANEVSSVREIERTLEECTNLQQRADRLLNGATTS